MELLNHFVAARLMKDAQLFERIGRYDATRPRLPKPRNTALPTTDAATEMPEGGAAESTRPARADRRALPADCPHEQR
ncbi:hypothetical protein [Bradyrhizobium sp. STM 3557]|uniref:hypothetical protein n=1 Tax=Bradyrhizobium sp. STM 3557 TaxID=578920 RepID=UPI00388DA4D8